MKATIEVKDRAEGDRIRLALQSDTTRAFVNVMGALQPLAPRTRQRVLAFVTESLTEDGPHTGSGEANQPLAGLAPATGDGH